MGIMLFKKTFKKVHDVVDEGSKNMQVVVKKVEAFVDKTEILLRSSDDSIKIIAGFVIVSMGMQILVAYTQLRVNIKMLNLFKTGGGK